jgi:hypothetical protein
MLKLGWRFWLRHLIVPMTSMIGVAVAFNYLYPLLFPVQAHQQSDWIGFWVPVILLPATVKVAFVLMRRTESQGSEPVGPPGQIQPRSTERRPKT